MAWDSRVGTGKAFSEESLVKWLGEVEGKQGTTTHTRESRYELRQRCGRKDCKCPHLFPCEGGWVDTADQWNGNEQVKPCVNCRPDVAAVVKSSGTRPDFQNMIRDLEKREAAASEHAWDD